MRDKVGRRQIERRYSADYRFNGCGRLDCWNDRCFRLVISGYIMFKLPVKLICVALRRTEGGKTLKNNLFFLRRWWCERKKIKQKHSPSISLSLSLTHTLSLSLSLSIYLSIYLSVYLFINLSFFTQREIITLDRKSCHLFSYNSKVWLYKAGVSNSRTQKGH